MRTRTVTEFPSWEGSGVGCSDGSWVGWGRVAHNLNNTPTTGQKAYTFHGARYSRVSHCGSPLPLAKASFFGFHSIFW